LFVRIILAQRIPARHGLGRETSGCVLSARDRQRPRRMRAASPDRHRQDLASTQQVRSTQDGGGELNCAKTPGLNFLSLFPDTLNVPLEFLTADCWRLLLKQDVGRVNHSTAPKRALKCRIQDSTSGGSDNSLTHCPMNLRQAAALALVGWYLMVQPSSVPRD
jgi:hypothetical protein